MTRLPWETVHTSQKTRKNSQYKTLGTRVGSRRCSTTPLNQRPDFAQAKRECKRIHDEHVKKTQQEYRPILVINNHDNEEDKHPKESTSTTIESILELAGGSLVQSPRETCRIRLRQQIGTVTIGRREAGILGILHGLRICDFSHLGPVSVDGRYTSR